jgi:hypothetical protein
MNSPFVKISDKVKELEDMIALLEQDCVRDLPGVPWDFSALRQHLAVFGKLIFHELPLQASIAHKLFSVSLPASIMGKKSTEKKRAAALLAARKGGRAISHAKAAACRANLELARLRKRRKQDARLALLSEEDWQKISMTKNALRRAKKERAQLHGVGYKIHAEKTALINELTMALMRIRRGESVQLSKKTTKYVATNTRNRNIGSFQFPAVRLRHATK